MRHDNKIYNNIKLKLSIDEKEFNKYPKEKTVFLLGTFYS